MVVVAVVVAVVVEVISVVVVVVVVVSVSLVVVVVVVVVQDVVVGLGTQTQLLFHRCQCFEISSRPRERLTACFSQGNDNQECRQNNHRFRSNQKGHRCSDTS